MRKNQGEEWRGTEMLNNPMDSIGFLHTFECTQVRTQRVCVFGTGEGLGTLLRSLVGKVYKIGDFHSCPSGPLA